MTIASALSTRTRSPRPGGGKAMDDGGSGVFWQAARTSASARTERLVRTKTITPMTPPG
jgi:hypothetical protein